MATPVRMPALAQTSDELRLTAWLKTEGEQVTEGEPLFEAETDKAELEDDRGRQRASWGWVPSYSYEGRQSSCSRDAKSTY